MEEKSPLKAHFGPFAIDEAEARLEQAGRAIELAPRAFQVLCELARRAGQLVTKDALLDAVWGHRHINEAALKNIVSQLRQALGDDAKDSAYIQTVPRRGYRFIAALDSPRPSLQTLAAQPVAQTRDRPSVPPLIGRTAHRQVLHAALESARAGQKQLVFLVGDAGMGKSVLVETLISEVTTPSACGQCIEHYGESEPYMPVLEALNELCRSNDNGGLVETMRQVAPTWLLQMPWLLSDQDRHLLQREAMGASQDRMLREFGELIDRFTVTQPLLLVLEDLHWSDPATVQLLGYLARRRSRCALMVLATFRPTELILKEHPLSTLRRDLRLRGQCSDVALDFFSEAELHEYLQAKLGQTAPEGFIRSLHSQTLGLPLLVNAVVEELLACGRLGWSQGTWLWPVDSLHFPRSISTVVQIQLERLLPAQCQILEAASVCGMEFQHLSVAKLLQLEAESVVEMLEQASQGLPWLQRRGTATQADGRVTACFGFAHAVYREVVYERIPALLRGRLHLRWAETLVQVQYPDSADLSAELALHFERGNAPVLAAQQWTRVASHALACSAPESAWQAASHALALADGRLEPRQELELRSLQAVSLTRLRVITDLHTATAFEKARALGPVPGPAWQAVMQGCWWIRLSRAEYVQAQQLALDMLAQAEQLGDLGLRLTAHISLGIGCMMRGQFKEARPHLENALEIGNTSPAVLDASHFVHDPKVETMVALALVYWLDGSPQAARHYFQLAISQAVSNRHPISEAIALYSASIMHALAGEFDVVRSLTERLYDAIQDHQLPEKRSGFAWLHGQSLVAAGQVQEGLHEMRLGAQEASDLGLRHGLCGFHYHYALACTEAGLREDAISHVKLGLALAEETGEKMLLSPLLQLQARDEWFCGRPEQARSILQAALECATAQGAALFELQALALATEIHPQLLQQTRLRELLHQYEGDISPLIQRLKALFN